MKETDKKQISIPLLSAVLTLPFTVVNFITSMLWGMQIFAFHDYSGCEYYQIIGFGVRTFVSCPLVSADDPCKGGTYTYFEPISLIIGYILITAIVSIISVLINHVKKRKKLV